VPLNFPSSPTVGQTYTLGSRSWTWNGSGWYASGSSASPVFLSAATTSVGLTVQGLASQTADLLELQNSSSTILAKFDASGNLTAPNHEMSPIVSSLLFGGM